MSEIAGKICLACANTFPEALEMCPERYNSDHSQEHMTLVAKALSKMRKPKGGEYKIEQLQKAIATAKLERSFPQIVKVEMTEKKGHRWAIQYPDGRYHNQVWDGNTRTYYAVERKWQAQGELNKIKREIRNG